MRDMKLYWARLPIHTGKVDMIILAVSTSAKYPSAALCSDSDSSRRTIIVQTDESGKPHSVSLMPLIDSMLEKPVYSCRTLIFLLLMQAPAHLPVFVSALQP